MLEKKVEQDKQLAENDELIKAMTETLWSMFRELAELRSRQKIMRQYFDPAPESGIIRIGFN